VSKTLLTALLLAHEMTHVQQYMGKTQQTGEKYQG
jgi:hypothetical protein